MQEGFGGGTEDRSLAPVRISRRRLAILIGAVVVVIAVVVGVVLLMSGGDDAPGEDEVAQRIVEAITAASTTSGGQPTGAFDTRALRTTLADRLPGWQVDLAASDDARRVGVSSRRISDSLCILAWSDVGGPQTATIDDIRLPCLAVMALQAAKNPV